MFYDDAKERQILQDSTSKTPYNIKGNGMPNISERRIIGGSKSKNGVTVFKPMTGGANKTITGDKPKIPNAWQEMIKKTRLEQKLSFKDAIKYIKSNNLYNKK